METRDIALIKALSNGAGGASYTLPIASETTLGGVKPVAKTDEMTQSVGVDAVGALFTKASSGGGSISGGKLIDEFDLSSGALLYTTDVSGCSELLIIISEALTCAGGVIVINGTSITYGLKSVSKCVYIRRVSSEAVAILHRSDTASDPIPSLIKVSLGENSFSDFRISFSSASAGKIQIYGG